MKRYKNLWDKICTLDNFKQAYKNAIKGKRKYEEVKFIEKYGPEKYLSELLEEVKENRYKVSKYKVFTRITGGKEREIWKLPMRDRIVQHAVMIYIEPIFRETFILDTFSSIKGRGIHGALKRIKRDVRKHGYTYYLKLDIKKCYPSLD
jgi:retron-type reverse transcriptase